LGQIIDNLYKGDFMVVSGIVAFSNLLEHEVYAGATTGKYSVVLTLDEDNAKKLSSQGVKLRQYEGVNGDISQQRKFASKFNVGIYSLDNEEFMGQPTRGSEGDDDRRGDQCYAMPVRTGGLGSIVEGFF
jgi:hypothetical protein